MLIIYPNENKLNYIWWFKKKIIYKLILNNKLKLLSKKVMIDNWKIENHIRQVIKKLKSLVKFRKKF